MRNFRCSRIARSIVISVVIGACAGHASAIPADESVRAILRDRLAAGQAVGLSVGVLEATGERYVNMGLREQGKPGEVTTDTVYEIGSISKSFTGVLLAQLVAEGKLSLDAKVQDLVPVTVKVPALNERSITLRDLATHTAGLPRLAPGYVPKDMKNPYAAYTVEDLWRGLAEARLAAEPGKNSDYSNMGFMLLSHILVTATGKASYEELIAERVLRPLGMTVSGVEVKRGSLALAHGPQNEPTPWWETPPTMGGVGAIKSSARDMLRFAAANVRSPVHSPYTLAQQAHWSTETEPGSRQMGLGWQIRKTKSGRTLHWHNGGTGGSRSFIGFDKAAGEAVVILGNSTHDVTALGMYLLDPEGSPLPPVKKTVTLEPALLDQMAGEYLPSGSDKPTLWIMRAGDRLLARTEGGAPQPLEAESAMRFSTPNNALVIERLSAADPVTLGITLAAGETPKVLVRRAVRPVLALSPIQLQPLVGRYKASGGTEFTVTVEGEVLVLSAGGSRGVTLEAESSTDFVARALNARVAFRREGDAPAVELRWTQLGVTTVAKRNQEMSAVK